MIKTILLICLTSICYGESIDSSDFYFNLESHQNLKEKSYNINKALFHIDETRPSVLLNKIYIELAILNRKTSNFNDAIKYARSAVETGRQLSDSLLLFKSFSVLASALYKSGQLDSAIEYYRISERSLEVTNFHGKAALYNNLGNCYSDLDDFHQAYDYYFKSKEMFAELKDSSSVFSTEINIADTYIQWGKFGDAKRLLDSLNIIADHNGWIDRLFVILDLKVDLIAKQNNLNEVKLLIDSISELEHIQMSSQISDAQIKYETEKIDKENTFLKIESKQRKLTIFVLLLFLLFGIIAFIIYNKNQILKKKLLQEREENKKQTALSEERTRIASEMHDDLGGGLTTIKFLSQKVYRKSKDEGIKTQVKKIVNQSETLVNNMSEIIWAMNAGFDTLSSLISYSRRYAHEYLETHDIAITFKVEGVVSNIKLTGTERRNIFLIIKESLHNAVKHAQCDHISILFKVDKNLEVIIKDNGVGIVAANDLGNGLKNMKNRMESIGGAFNYQNNNGLEIILTYPNLKTEEDETTATN